VTWCATGLYEMKACYFLYMGAFLGSLLCAYIICMHVHGSIKTRVRHQRG
jgi:hypothetical protein